MLKVVANIYSNTKEDFEMVTRSLINSGYEIAYQNEGSGIVLKEVSTLDSENPEV